MNIGLFFGSFNPVHLGHLCIGEYILNETHIDKIRFVVSPQNPLKKIEELMPAALRFEMLQKSTIDHPTFEVSAIEFNLPLPSYTDQTLTAIEALEEGHKYTIIMGSDTLETLDQWRGTEHILSYPIMVYKRKEQIVNPFPDNKNIEILDCPIIDISSTRIRKMLKENKSIKYLVHEEIINLLKNN